MKRKDASYRFWTIAHTAVPWQISLLVGRLPALQWICENEKPTGTEGDDDQPKHPTCGYTRRLRAPAALQSWYMPRQLDVQGERIPDYGDTRFLTQLRDTNFHNPTDRCSGRQYS